MARVKPIDYEQIIRSQYLVRFERKPLDEDALYGFVLAVGETLTLLHTLETSTYTLNGYSVICNADVSRYAVYDRPDYYFDSRVLRLKGITPQPQPEISVASLPELLTSVARCYPLFTIHREAVNNEVCFVGRLEGMTPKTFTLFEIDSCAEWEGPHRHRFQDVTRVDFGGGYEEALALVARMDAGAKSRRKRPQKSS